MKAKAYITDLHDLKEVIGSCQKYTQWPVEQKDRFVINPSLEVFSVQWKGLINCLDDSSKQPEAGQETLLVWKRADSNKVCFRPAFSQDLLALKIVHDGMSIKQVAKEGGATLGEISEVLLQAVNDNLIFRPLSKICRDKKEFPETIFDDVDYSRAEVFTLQWHITQACDLHCKHCYDRSERVRLEFDRALLILDDLYAFCQKQNVLGQVTFTGGNPLLYYRFLDIYKAAAERGFMLGVLGNPTTGQMLDDICTIQKPEFFQVSLEGLQEHNDHIRGVGHFERTLAFLKLLRQKQIYSMVMLTLTKENYEQVLPLGDLLKEKVDRYLFNRLTLFGEGANLQPMPVEKFDTFIADYKKASLSNPVLGLKDNLLNRLNCLEEDSFFGGCAGFGCGAAFNFVSVLPDGEVHGCRKFPSKIGNIFTRSFYDIYYSNSAEKYRQGSVECSDCKIKSICRGCPAVVAGHGMDPFLDRDPYCKGKITE